MNFLHCIIIYVMSFPALAFEIFLIKSLCFSYLIIVSKFILWDKIPSVHIKIIKFVSNDLYPSIFLLHNIYKTCIIYKIFWAQIYVYCCPVFKAILIFLC